MLFDQRLFYFAQVFSDTIEFLNGNYRTIRREQRSRHHLHVGILIGDAWHTETEKFVMGIAGHQAGSAGSIELDAMSLVENVDCLIEYSHIDFVQRFAKGLLVGAKDFFHHLNSKRLTRNVE
jgi:hypothetical protein